MNRREALARLGALMVAGGTGLNAVAAETTAPLSAATPTVRTGEPLVIAHITDTHIIDQYHSEKWVADCLHQIQSHPLKPKLILHTGDVVYDTLRVNRKRAEHLWSVWQNTVKNENSLPLKVAIGNHDLLGGKLPAGDPINQDPKFGKALAQDKLSLDKTYYSFDFGDWHFVMLDSIYPIMTDGSHDWIAKLGDEQLDWLKSDLAAVPKNRPVVVGSHIPIAQAASLLHQVPSAEGTYTLGPRNIMTDARQIIDLFRLNPNVKLCFSGHTHLRDRLMLEETSYINGGSVCGAHWKVENQDPKRPGFSIVTLHPDGKFDYSYENYGWKWA